MGSNGNIYRLSGYSPPNVCGKVSLSVNYQCTAQGNHGGINGGYAGGDGDSCGRQAVPGTTDVGLGFTTVRRKPTLTDVLPGPHSLILRRLGGSGLFLLGGRQ